MRGTILVIDPGKSASKKSVEIDGKPTLDALKDAIGGGYIEKVPGFDSVEIDNRVRKCVVFGDEDGKCKGMRVNAVATGLWHHALLRRGHPGLVVAATGAIADFLVGPIALVYGDEEFMRSL
jgi:hypothetical protein